MSNELPNYKLILAGSLGVGKTTIYDVVKKHWPEGRGEASKWTHCVELDNEIVKVTLWDTTKMESHGVKCMTRNYFSNSDGVILVCNQSKLTSLQDLIGWIQAVNENSYVSTPVFALWCNAVDQYSGVEVTDELLESFVKEHSVCLSTKLPDMKETVVKSYRQLIEVVHLSSAFGRQAGVVVDCGAKVCCPPLPKDQSKQSDRGGNQWCTCS